MSIENYFKELYIYLNLSLSDDIGAGSEGVNYGHIIEFPHLETLTEDEIDEMIQITYNNFPDLQILNNNLTIEDKITWLRVNGAPEGSIYENDLGFPDEFKLYYDQNEEWIETEGLVSNDSNHSLDITGISVKWFKNIGTETKFHLDQLNVIVGTNNSGKSSFLQAIQFANSCAQSIQQDSDEKSIFTKSIPFEDIIYAPLSDLESVSHNRIFTQNSAKSPHHPVIKFFTNSGETSVSISRGKNKNVTISIDETSTAKRLADRKNPLCSYVPGLAGISNREPFMTKGMVYKSIARGDANKVFRNVLYLLKMDEENNISKKWSAFQTSLSKIFENLKLEVRFNPDIDEFIQVEFSRDGKLFLPIDAAGTGILQVIQILSYIAFYEPDILILDEPDSHLHPDNQRKLAEFLEYHSSKNNFKVLISTHSRNMMESLEKLGANFVWMENGLVNNFEFDFVDSLLKLGEQNVQQVFDASTKYLLLTEDEDTSYIKHILMSSKTDIDNIRILSFDGCSNTVAAEKVADIYKVINPDAKIIIHLDRDFQSDEEIDSLVRKYNNKGISVFITENSDIEGYFLEFDHVRYLIDNRNEKNKMYGGRMIEISDDELMTLIENAKRDSIFKVFGVLCEKTSRQPNADTFKQIFEEITSNPDYYWHGKEAFGNLSAKLNNISMPINLNSPSPSLSNKTIAGLFE